MLWLATLKLPVALWRLAAVGIAVVTVLSMNYRLPIHRQINTVLKEYVAAASVVPAGAVALPLNLEERYQAEGLKPVLGRAKFDAFEHAASYATLKRPFANLRNFEPERPYFPLQYRPGRDPNIYLSPDGAFSRFEQRPLHLSLAAYRARTGVRIDYVLVWGRVEEVSARPDIVDLYDQLNSDYELVFISSPRGLMHVYRHRFIPQTVN